VSTARTAIAAIAGLLLCAASAAAEPASVTADLNLWQGPGTYYPAVATIPYGEPVEVLSCQGAWCEIDWRGYGGFASRSFLAYGYGPAVAPAPVVVMPPPPPEVVYAEPYYGPAPRIYGSGVGFFFGF
jgi:uncharacterized protein YraI